MPPSTCTIDDTPCTMVFSFSQNISYCLPPVKSGMHHIGIVSRNGHSEVGVNLAPCSELDVQIKLGMDWFLSWVESDESNGEKSVLFFVYLAFLIKVSRRTGIPSTIVGFIQPPLPYDLGHVLFRT